MKELKKPNKLEDSIIRIESFCGEQGSSYCQVLECGCHNSGGNNNLQNDDDILLF